LLFSPKSTDFFIRQADAAWVYFADVAIGPPKR